VTSFAPAHFCLPSISPGLLQFVPCSHTRLTSTHPFPSSRSCLCLRSLFEFMWRRTLALPILRSCLPSFHSYRAPCCIPPLPRCSLSFAAVKPLNIARSSCPSSCVHACEVLLPVVFVLSFWSTSPLFGPSLAGPCIWCFIDSFFLFAIIGTAVCLCTHIFPFLRGRP